MTEPETGRTLPSRRPRRPDPRPPRTRRAILQAGHTLMAAGGLEAATISAIADAAHVAVGSIYSHFSGKEALVLEVFLDRAEPALRDFMARSAQIAPEQRLQEAGEALVRFAVEEPALTAALVSGRLLGVSDAAEAPRQRVLGLGEECVRLLRRDLGAALPDRMASDDEIAPLLLTFWLGLMSAVSRTDSFAISGERAAELLRSRLGAMKFLRSCGGNRHFPGRR